MRIALVSPGDYPIPPIRGGSVEIYMHQLSQKLAQTNTVTVFSRGSSSSSQKNLSYQRLLPVKGNSFLGLVCKAIKNQPFQVIQVDNRPIIAKRLRAVSPKTPIVLNLHSLTFLSPRHLPVSLARGALRSPHAIVVNSEYLKNCMLTRCPSLTGRLHVIHPGVDLNRFISRFSQEGAQIRQSIRQKHEVRQNEIVLLFAGRFLHQKGIHVILSAFSRMYKKNKRLRLWIVGGSQRAQLTPYEKRIRKLASGLPVSFLGFVTPAQLSKYYLGADIFLCPSQSSEAFGMVNLEAAATGLPSIGSKAWGIQESILDGTSGIHVMNYRSALAWQASIESLINSPQLRQRLSRGAVRWARNHSWTQVARRFHNLYQKIT